MLLQKIGSRFDASSRVRRRLLVCNAWIGCALPPKQLKLYEGATPPYEGVIILFKRMTRLILREEACVVIFIAIIGLHDFVAGDATCTFTRFPNQFIPGHNNDQTPNQSLDECKAACCDAEASYTWAPCLSFDFNTKTGMCALSNRSSTSPGITLRSDTSGDLDHYDAVPTPPPSFSPSIDPEVARCGSHPSCVDAFGPSSGLDRSDELCCPMLDFETFHGCCNNTEAPTATPSRRPTKVPTAAPTRSPTLAIPAQCSQRPDCKDLFLDTPRSLCCPMLDNRTYHECCDNAPTPAPVTAAPTAAPTVDTQTPTTSPVPPPTLAPSSAPTTVPTTARPTTSPSASPTPVSQCSAHARCRAAPYNLGASGADCCPMLDGTTYHACCDNTDAPSAYPTAAASCTNHARCGGLVGLCWHVFTHLLLLLSSLAACRSCISFLTIVSTRACLSSTFSIAVRCSTATRS